MTVITEGMDIHTVTEALRIQAGSVRLAYMRSNETPGTVCRALIDRCSRTAFLGWEFGVANNESQARPGARRSTKTHHP